MCQRKRQNIHANVDPTMSSDGGEHSGKRFLLLLTIIAERNMTDSLTNNTVLHKIMLKTNTSLTGFT